jgi:hypothetical protein
VKRIQQKLNYKKAGFITCLFLLPTLWCEGQTRNVSAFDQPYHYMLNLELDKARDELKETNDPGTVLLRLLFGEMPMKK